MGVSLDADRTRDPHRRGVTAEKHIQDCWAWHRARELEENTASIIAGIEGAMVERPTAVLFLNLYKGVVSGTYVAQRDGAVFQVSIT
jgi:hypothetical protein